MHTIRDLDESLLDAAGELLARRHAGDRAVVPSLPRRFEDPEVARRAVAAVLESSGAKGVVATRGDAPIGFLAGAPLIDTLRGRAAWSGIGAHATGDPVEYPTMYAALAEHWVEIGCLEHYVVLPPDEAALRAWFSLGFGMQQVHALTRTDGVPEPRTGSHSSIRRAGRDDLDAVRPLTSVIGEHQAASPVFAAHLPQIAADYVDGHAELLADESVGYFVAERAGRAVAYLAMIPAEGGDGDLYIPERCVELAVAATLPEQRGSGVMTALTHHAFAWAQAEGFEFCLTDWRSTNRLSARFWPRFGFEPVAYRLHRTIDARIAWAR
jgi:GNAT superfamily N-acetyltransferase